MKIKKIKKLLMSMVLFPIVPILFASPDNVEDEIKFGGTVVIIDNEIVAKITAFNKNTAVKEENITGSEDIIAGTNVLHDVFTPVSIGETATVEGVAIESSNYGPDDGQSELKDAVDNGIIITMRQTRNTGYGYLMTGFFTSYDEGADTSGVYKFKATFRVNTKQEIVPGS